MVREDDEVFFVAARKDIQAVLSEVRGQEDPIRRVVIAGGGNIGMRLAAALENSNQVKVIERGYQRARRISERLDKAIVLHGDATDENLLLEENIDRADVFVAVTNAEEANILSAMLARRIGANKVMALINKPAYADLAATGMIDIAISPQQITLGSLLAHVRKGDVVKVHSLRHGAAEAIEAVAHGDIRESGSSAAPSGTSGCPGRDDQRDRSRRGRADGPSRHGDRGGRSRHPVRRRPPADRRSGTALRGRPVTRGVGPRAEPPGSPRQWSRAEPRDRATAPA